MQIRLFHLKNSRSQRITWFLEELGLDYELTIKDHSGIGEDKNSPINYQNFQLSKLLNKERLQS